MKAVLVAILAFGLPAAANAADMNAADRFTDEAYFGPPETPSWWQLWGSASLGFEYYNDNFPGDEEAAGNVAGEILFKAPSGFNVKVRGGAAAYDQGTQAGFVNLDLFYANPEFAVGVSAGSFFTDGFESVWGVVQAAKFFSRVDIGAYLEVDGFRKSDPIYAAGGWARGYLTPDTSLSLNYEHDWNNDGVNVNFLTGRAEHRFRGTNFSTYADAEYGWTEWGFESWDIFGGITLYFDPEGTTLQQYQRAAKPFNGSCCW